ERRDLLRGNDRVALDDEADPGRHAQLLRDCRRTRERYERVVRVPVLERQITARRVGSLAARGDVGVLGEEERLEAALLGGARKLRRGRGVIGRENRQSEIHRSSRCSPVRCLTRARYRSTKRSTPPRLPQTVRP